MWQTTAYFVYRLCMISVITHNALVLIVLSCGLHAAPSSILSISSIEANPYLMAKGACL